MEFLEHNKLSAFLGELFDVLGELQDVFFRIGTVGLLD